MAFLQKPWNHLTIDGLHRLAGRSRAERLAIIESPDTGAWHCRPALQVTAAEADQQITRFARQLNGMGLQAGDAVLLYLPNTIDAVTAIIGTMAAGMIPCPVSLGHSIAELERAAEAVSPRAIVTVTRHADTAPLAAATEVAVRHFGIRVVAAFGADVTEGVIALDRWTPDHVPAPEAARKGDPNGIALVTVEASGEGFTAHRRTHSQLICDALALSATARIGRMTPLVTTLSPASAFSVLATCVLPALTGAELHLHGVFNAAAFADQLNALNGPHAILPGAIEPALEEFSAGLDGGLGTPILVHRIPACLEQPRPALGHSRRSIDVACFGEAAVIARVRASNRHFLELDARLQHPAAFAIDQDRPWIEAALDGRGEVLLRGPSLSFTALRKDAGQWHGTGAAGTLDGDGAISIAARVAPAAGAASAA